MLFKHLTLLEISVLPQVEASCNCNCMTKMAVKYTDCELYCYSVLYMYQTDLVNTIGESAAMGASGVVIWEKSLAVKTQVII